MGGNMRLGGKDVELIKNTFAWKMFGKNKSIRMRFRHRLEVDPKFIDTLTEKGLVFSGNAPGENIMQILELPDHPFFVGTQAHPCMTSRPTPPQEMFVGLLAAARKLAYPDIDLPEVLATIKKVRKRCTKK